MLLPMTLLRRCLCWAWVLTEPLEKTPSLLASLLAACHLNATSKAELGYASAVLSYEVIPYCNILRQMHLQSFENVRHICEHVLQQHGQYSVVHIGQVRDV